MPHQRPHLGLGQGFQQVVKAYAERPVDRGHSGAGEAQNHPSLPGVPEDD